MRSSESSKYNTWMTIIGLLNNSKLKDTVYCVYMMNCPLGFKLYKKKKRCDETILCVTMNVFNNFNRSRSYSLDILY